MPFDPRAALQGLNVPHLDQYFGVWAIQEETLRAALVRIERMNLRAHVLVRQGKAKGRKAAEDPAADKDDQMPEASGRGSDYEMTADGVAVIEVSGPMMKYASSLSGGTSTVYTRRQIRLAVADERVLAIALVFDTPGGTVAGTRDLADDIAAATKKKPTLGYAEDLCCSAGYWAIAQCSKVVCNPTGIIGSIGVYSVLYDSSKMAKKDGIAVHVVKAGEFKGTGVDGTPVTPEQLAEMQRLVDSLNGHFLEAVATGRKMPLSKVKSLADGRVHVGTEAKALGLVDAVQSFDEALADLSKSIQPGGSRAASEVTSNPVSEEGAPIMAGESTTTTAPAAPAAAALVAAVVLGASFEQLRSAFPKASNDFICDQLAKKATVEQAQGAYIASLEASNDQLKAGAGKPGVTGVTDRPAATATREEATAEPIKAWEDAIEARLKGCGGDKAKAIRQLAKEKPELHASYLEAYNAAHASARKKPGKLAG